METLFFTFTRHICGSTCGDCESHVTGYLRDNRDRGLCHAHGLCRWTLIPCLRLSLNIFKVTAVNAMTTVLTRFWVSVLQDEIWRELLNSCPKHSSVETRTRHNCTYQHFRNAAFILLKTEMWNQATVKQCWKWRHKGQWGTCPAKQPW